MIGAVVGAMGPEVTPVYFQLLPGLPGQLKSQGFSGPILFTHGVAVNAGPLPFPDCHQLQTLT